jgi:hypothetical protein
LKIHLKNEYNVKRLKRPQVSVENELTDWVKWPPNSNTDRLKSFANAKLADNTYLYGVPLRGVELEFGLLCHGFGCSDRGCGGSDVRAIDV